MNHKDLVDRAVRWLRSRHSCAVVFAEMTTAVSETPDVIGWYRSTSHVVEVKISRSDFYRDRDKIHVRAGQSMGHYRWYFTPQGLLHVEDLPPGYGLAEVRGSRVFVVREPEPRVERCVANEIQLLVSAVQRSQLGVQFDREAARWESYAKGRARQRVNDDLKKPKLTRTPSKLKTLSDEEIEETARKMHAWGEAMKQRTKGLDNG